MINAEQALIVFMLDPGEDWVLAVQNQVIEVLENQVDEEVQTEAFWVHVQLPTSMVNYAVVMEPLAPGVNSLLVDKMSPWRIMDSNAVRLGIWFLVDSISLMDILG